jgi:hypothetical protein
MVYYINAVCGWRRTVRRRAEATRDKVECFGTRLQAANAMLVVPQFKQVLKMRKFKGVFNAKPATRRKESTTIDRPSYFAAQK